VIEGVTMMQRKVGQGLEVPWLNGQKSECVPLNSADHFGDVALESSNPDFDRDFPLTNDTDNDVIGRVCND
jgi:hypothetical protein